MAVEGRLEFIEKEMHVNATPSPHRKQQYMSKGGKELTGCACRKRVEMQIQDMEAEGESKKMEVCSLRRAPTGCAVGRG